MHRAHMLATLVIVCGASPAVGQPREPRFEVASVKRNLSNSPRASIQVPPAGTLTYTNVPLRVLIRDAYQVDPYAEPYRLIAGGYAGIIGQTTDGPGSNVPRYDVIAKPPDNTAPSDRRAMMRALLEDRFNLRVHREVRQLPVYALKVARAGRLGPNLARSKFDCRAYLAQRREGGANEEPVDAEGSSWCLSPAPANLILAGVYAWRFAGPFALFAQRAQPYVDRPIVDATGLSGNFEWVVTFALAGSSTSADVPGFTTAIQEQLGLKLESRQAPVEVLVIDSVQPPREN